MVLQKKDKTLTITKKEIKNRVNRGMEETRCTRIFPAGYLS